MAILNEYEMKQIIHAHTKDPFGILGMHKLNENQLVIRTFHPAAKSVKFIDEKDGKEIYMEKVHEDGLFELVYDKSHIVKYQYIYEYFNGETWTTVDPYSFLPVLTEYDIYLFRKGDHHRIYEKMGAHIIEHDGVWGTHFSVWAPEAVRLSVIGSFNNWDGRVHQMRMLGGSGVWELFIPGIIEGDLYRFEIKTKYGHVLKI